MPSAMRRVGLICVAAVVASSVSACRVLKRADSPTKAPISAAANAIDAPDTEGTGPCPFSADEASRALGGRWTVFSLPSGGCNYAQAARSILVTEVPLPTALKGRRAALAQARRPCDAESLQPISTVAGAFVCRQGTLIEAATIAGDRLVVVCTAAGTDPEELPAIRTQLSSLIARAD